MGGVFAAVASILFSVISSSVSGGVSHKSIKDSAYAYFSVACLVIILCLISVYFLNRMVSTTSSMRDNCLYDTTSPSHLCSSILRSQVYK